MMDEGIARLRDWGVATVYEASGRQGLLDVDWMQLIPGSRAAGPARTVLCGQDDNLMVHAAIERIEPGEVLVQPAGLVDETAREFAQRNDAEPGFVADQDQLGVAARG